MAALRRCIWAALFACAVLDGGLGEKAIFGGDFCNIENGVWECRDPSLWPWIAGLVLLQGVLIAIVIRLRQPGPAPGLTPSGPIR